MTETKRITHMSNVHPADDTRIFHKECVSLAKAGFDVTLIARPPRKPFDNGDVRVIEHNAPRNRALRMLVGSLRIIPRALGTRSDLYHFHDPELIPAGLVLKLLGKRVIYDVHEDIPAQLLSKPWIPSKLRPIASKFIERINAFANFAFDGIVVAREDAARAFNGPKVTLVQNYALLSEFDRTGQTAFARDPDPDRVVYFGGITLLRGLREMIAATEIITKRRNLKLELIGPLQPKTLSTMLAESPARKHIHHQPWADRKEMTEILSSASVGLVLFHPVPNHITSYPNKLFEYMGAGLPFVASNFPYWKQFVDDIGSGVRIDPLDPTAIADAIEYLLDNPDVAHQMGEAGWHAVRDRFSWETEAEKLIKLVAILLGKR